MGKITSIILAFAISGAAQATELKPAGNAEAAALFAKYQAETKGCDRSLPGKRVLLTGFGLFSGLSLNSAGAVVANIADPAIWPAAVAANELVQLQQHNLHDGKFLTDRGAQLLQRNLTLGGEELNLCMLVLDVLWDTAGAIVAFEMDRFQPERVLMLGGGGGPFLEGGALNEAQYIEGYYADGKPARQNMPVSPRTLPSVTARELPMLWNNKQILADVEPLLHTATLHLVAVPGARPTNAYLCNHVSFVALAAAKGERIELAGGLIQLEPQIRSNPRVGFFHLPWGLTLKQDTMEAWGSLVLSVLHFMAR